jgi:hypothetical protein
MTDVRNVGKPPDTFDSGKSAHGLKVSREERVTQCRTAHCGDQAKGLDTAICCADSDDAFSGITFRLQNATQAMYGRHKSDTCTRFNLPTLILEEIDYRVRRFI